MTRKVLDFRKVKDPDLVKEILSQNIRKEKQKGFW